MNLDLRFIRALRIRNFIRSSPSRSLRWQKNGKNLRDCLHDSPFVTENISICIRLLSLSHSINSQIQPAKTTNCFSMFVCNRLQLIASNECTSETQTKIRWNWGLFPFGENSFSELFIIPIGLRPTLAFCPVAITSKNKFSSHCYRINQFCFSPPSRA